MREAAPSPGAALHAALADVRRAWQRTAALAAASRALIAAAILVALAGLAERAVAPGDGVALALAAGTAAAATVTAVFFLAPLRRRPTDRQVARFVEERRPECADAIVTAVDVAARGRDAGAFAPLVMADAAQRLAALDTGDIVDPAERRRATRLAATAAPACVLALVAAAPLGGRAADVAYVRLFPASVTLAVAPGDLRVAAGRPATIVASLHGRARTLARLSAQITLDASGKTVTVPMERAGDSYRFTVPSVGRSFHYMVAAGPAVSRAYAVTALHPARIERIDLQYDFPAFTGLKPRLERDGGDVYAPEGTRVRVIVHTDHPVREGALAFSQGQPPTPLVRVDDRTMAASLTVADEAAYRVALVDRDELRSESVEYFLRVMDDHPPEVHILRPGGDEGITPLQEVPIEARADDDYGIARMDLVYSVAGGPERIVPFASLSGTDLARVGARMLAAEDLKVKPGDVIAYYARAWDVPRAKESTLARSEIFFLEVKPFNEEYSMAVSQAGMQAATATQLDGLISAQKEIISATWNLERRSGAGRSASDIKGVADAQAELKGRAERAAGAQQQRRRFGGFVPPAFAFGSVAASQGTRRQDQPQAGDDPVLKAVDAMGRAAQELQGQKTAGAIPHEMAALNALLQAQAEIRQKQIAQQQGNAGGGWGNRQGQDLSSLFDRELKRQQKSNYENQVAVESTPEGTPGESALDRIRDLARRQEELTRQQRELAKGGLSAEEAKRQLEKLTREQEELSRAVEQLARAGAESAEGGKGAGGAGGEGAMGAKGAEGVGRDLSDALRQMRDAASEGKKEDAAAAVKKGQQAADALRRAEAQMQNGSPDAQKRALGDLQLESQQIAAAQQRVADEAARLDGEGGGTADARRRLAGDKERLADRVDALQQAAQRLPAAGDAARDLAAQQIGSRMRAGAQQLRDGRAGNKTAPAEQQVADALDRVARKIGAPDAGGAKGGEKADQNGTAQLAGDLDELRDARERIARLERQMRELQQGARGLSPEARSATGDAQGARGARGAEGAAAGRAGQGAGGTADVAALQRQLDQEVQRTRDLLSRMQRLGGSSGANWSTPEEHEWSRSAPGTEAFKQDYAAWQSLTADVARALERAEASAASKLSAALARDRLRGGGSERVPDAYRRQVSRYFEAIAVRQGGRQ